MNHSSTVPKYFDARKSRRTKLYFDSRNLDTEWTAQIRRSKSDRWEYALFIFNEKNKLVSSQQSNDYEYLENKAVNFTNIF